MALSRPRSTAARPPASPAGSAAENAYREELRRWEEERQGLEGHLAGAIPALARLRALRTVDLAGLQRTLPAGATFAAIFQSKRLPHEFAA